MAAADLRVPFAALAAAFGVAAVVTPPGEDAIDTTVIWVNPAVESVPTGQEFQRTEPIRILALSRDEVPSVPHGTLIVAPERKDDVARQWLVDSPVGIDADQTKVLVIPAPDEDT